jgi:hypothetical protein
MPKARAELDHHHDEEHDEELDEELFVFKINIANQHASWPATKWSAFASILAVCLAAVAIAGLWFYAPTENVEAMGQMFGDKPAAARAAMADSIKGDLIE